MSTDSSKTFIRTITHSEIIMGSGKQSQAIDKAWDTMDNELNRLREEKISVQIVSTTAVACDGYYHISVTVEMSHEDKKKSIYKDLR